MAHIVLTDSVMKGLKNRIYRVGVELEGRWDKLPPGVNEIGHDGSVKFEVPNPTPRPDPHAFASANDFHRAVQRWANANAAIPNCGELASDILEPHKYPEWVKTMYPQHVNKTCGLHVHMSFKSARHYSILMVREYVDTVKFYLSEWAEREGFPKTHHIWERLGGKFDTCTDEFFPDLQAQVNSKIYDHNMKGKRYTIVNYCWSQHETIECRVLPMMDTADQAVRAIQRVLDVTNGVIARLGARREERQTIVVADSGRSESEHWVETL